MLYILIIVGVLTRLMPHPMNVAPIMALGLFEGTYFNKKSALIIPLGALFISDIFIGFYSIPIMLSVYACFAFGGYLGRFLKDKRSINRVFGATLLSSVVFFIVTNFALWAFSTYYPHTLTGLGQCYVAAIPFFRNSLLGDFAYVSLLFGMYELVGKRIDARLGLAYSKV